MYINIVYDEKINKHGCDVKEQYGRAPCSGFLARALNPAKTRIFSHPSTFLQKWQMRRADTMAHFKHAEGEYHCTYIFYAR